MFIVKIPEIDCWIDKGRFVGFNVIWKIIIFKTNIFWQLVNYLTNTLFFITKWGLNWTLKIFNLLEALWDCSTLIGQNPKERALERQNPKSVKILRARSRAPSSQGEYENQF